MKKLEQVLKQIRGNDNITITWQEVVLKSKVSFYVEGCGNAFFQFQGNQFFAIREITNPKFDFEVMYVAPLSPELVNELQSFNNEFTFQKNHFETLKKITFSKELKMSDFIPMMKENEDYKKKFENQEQKMFFSNKWCYALGHVFGHDKRKLFLEEYKKDQTARMQCSRCKENFNMHTIQHMPPTLHERILTYPSYTFYQMKNNKVITQSEFIQSANGISLYIGYFLFGLLIGIIMILTLFVMIDLWV